MVEQPSPWLLAAASVTGTSHQARGALSQDRFLVQVARDSEGAPVLIAAVADGASGAALSAFGARAAVNTFLGRVTESLSLYPHRQLTAADPCRWLSQIREAIEQRAREDCQPVDQYACTFAGVVSGRQKSVALSVGDAIAAIRSPDDAIWRFAVQPFKGEYRNQTCFVTEVNAEALAAVAELPGGLRSIAIATDGLEDLCTDRASRTIYSPFFESLAETLTQSREMPRWSRDQALGRYLASDAVNALTDDDKTLVLAVQIADA